MTPREAKLYESIGSLSAALQSGYFDIDDKCFRVDKPQVDLQPCKTATWRCHAHWANNRGMLLLAFGQSMWEAGVLGMYHVMALPFGVRDCIIKGSLVLSSWEPTPICEGDFFTGVWVERQRPLAGWIRDEELMRIVLPLGVKDSWNRDRGIGLKWRQRKAREKIERRLGQR